MTPTGRFLVLYLLLIPAITILTYWRMKSIILPIHSTSSSTSTAKTSTVSFLENNKNNEFSVQRAYDSLIRLSHEQDGFGEHAFTSQKCHNVHQWLLQYLHSTVAELGDRLKDSKMIEVLIDEQNESSEFKIEDSPVTGQQLRRYANVTNVLAMIRPRVSDQKGENGENDHQKLFMNDAILLNSHFDSRVSSTGAFDDGVPVVVMMELFSNLLHELLSHEKLQISSAAATTKTKIAHLLRRPIIFLWNGAEEMGLLGAHAFMNRHPWAQQVKSFINLEAAGFGGGAFLFQTTNAWITKEYAKTMVHPMGNAIGQDLFQTGIVPSDTDYRFFTLMKKQQQMHGVDSAFVENGHWYHTSLDSLTTNGYSHDDIKKSIVHMGDNSASLLRHLAYMNATFPDSSLDADSRSAYFDILGLFMVAYNVHTAKSIYLGVAIVSITLIVAQILTGKLSVVALVCSLLCLAGSMVGGAAFSVALSHVLIRIDRPLIWYALGPEYAFALYSLPAMFAVLLIAKLLFAMFPSNSINRSAMYASVMIIWMMVLGVTAHSGLGSSFLPAVVVVSFLLGLFSSSIGFLQVIVALLLPHLVFISFGFTFSASFSGMFGRSGKKPVDYIMGALLGLIGVCVASITLPFISPNRRETTTVKRANRMERSPDVTATRTATSSSSFGVSWVSLLTFALIVASLVYYGLNSEPYSALRPKRISLRHVITYDKNRVVDAYLNMRSTDPIPPEYVFNHVPSSSYDHGFRYNDTIKSHWISNIESKNLDDPVFYKNVLTENTFDPNVFNTQFTIKSEMNNNSTLTRYTVTLSNSKYVFNQQVFVRTRHPSHIARFHFAEQPNYDEKERAYSWDIVLGYARFDAEELNFNGPKSQSFSFDVVSGQETGIEIHVRSHFVDPEIWTVSIQEVLNALPVWTNTVPVVSSEHNFALSEQ